MWISANISCFQVVAQPAYAVAQPAVVAARAVLPAQQVAYAAQPIAYSQPILQAQQYATPVLAKSAYYH